MPINFGNIAKGAGLFLVDPTGLGRKAARGIGDAIQGPGPIDPNDPRFNIDPDNLLRQRYDNLNEADLFRLMSRLVSGQSQTSQQFLGPGVSQMQATELAEASNQRREGAAFDAASGAYLGFQQLKGDALENVIAGNQFGANVQLNDRYWRQGRKDEFLNMFFNFIGSLGEGAVAAGGGGGGGGGLATTGGFNPFTGQWG